MSELDAKVAVLTGAASGIGLAAVRLFAAEGARVYAADRPGSQRCDSLETVRWDVMAIDWHSPPAAPVNPPKLPRRHCSWHRRRRASSPAPNWSSTAA